MTRAVRLAAATIGVLGVSAAGAPAAIRYAAEGTGADPCANPAATCLAQPPNVRLTTKPAKKTAGRLAGFGFSSDQPSASFECKLDRKAFGPCRSPYKRRVAPGRHGFSVRAVGPGGTSRPLVYRWRVLRSAPR